MSDLLFEYKVKAKHRLGWKEFSFYATTHIEEFLNRNSIDYVRNATDTVENRLFKENKRLNNIINELEKYCIEEIEDYEKRIKYHKKNKDLRSGILDLVGEYEGEKVCFEDMLGKLQELKGSDSNE